MAVIALILVASRWAAGSRRAALISDPGTEKNMLANTSASSCNPAADSWQWWFWDVNQRKYQTPSGLAAVLECYYTYLIRKIRVGHSHSYAWFWAWQKPFVQTWCPTMHEEPQVSSGPIPQPPYRCGSPVIGKELSKQSYLNSDLVGTPAATRFSFFQGRDWSQFKALDWRELQKSTTTSLVIVVVLSDKDMVQWNIHHVCKYHIYIYTHTCVYMYVYKYIYIYICNIYIYLFVIYIYT